MMSLSRNATVERDCAPIIMEEYMPRISSQSPRLPRFQRPALRSLAMALAIGAMGAGALVAPVAPAHAAKKQKQEGPKYDLGKEYRASAAETQKLIESGDAEAAKAALAKSEALAQNPDEKFLTGQFYIQLGGKLKDPALQRKGLEMSLASGRTPAADVGRFNYFVGSMAYQDKDYAAARQYLKAALDAGYTDNDTAAIYAEAFFQDNMIEEGLAALKQAIDASVAAGTTPPETWYRRGTAIALKNKSPNVGQWTKMLVEAYPNTTNWRDALVIFRDGANYGSQENLDLMRLMRRTDALQSERDYAEYVENADPVRLPGEVVAVIDEGRAAGKIKPDSGFFNDQYSLAKGKIAADKASLASSTADAKTSKNGLTALGTADALLSYGDADEAVSLYQLALDKGGIDRDRALTRLGIANAYLGDYDAANAAFAQVSGARKPLAEYWMMWTKQKMGGGATTEAPAPAGDDTPETGS